MMDCKIKTEPLKDPAVAAKIPSKAKVNSVILID